MSSYCDFAPSHPLHGPYHDSEYGFPRRDEAVLFERLVLEINQAGLSWETILKKRDGFRRAYDGFDVDAVAAYGPGDRERLLADPGIIRNRLKVDAAIHNAQVIRSLACEYGMARPSLIRLNYGLNRCAGGGMAVRNIAANVDRDPDLAGRIARAMLDGAPRALTLGATHFHTRSVRPGWSNRFPRTAAIGAHLFYRQP